MSDVQRRVVFYDNTGDKARFWDWSLVTTALGTMAEPFTPNARFAPTTPWQDYDPTDAANRIDEIRAMPRDLNQKILGGGEHHLMGGVLMPLVGP